MKKKSSLFVNLLQVFYLLVVAFPALVSIIYIIFHPSALSYPSSILIRALKFNCILESLLIANFYIFYLVLFPGLIKTRRLKSFLLWSILVTLLTIGFAAILIKNMPFAGYVDKRFSIQFANISLGIILNPLFACGIAGIKFWLLERYERQKVEKINLETSLALLKAQINPHFLFNTLNNIDVLIEKDAAAASDYLKKLSDILRFMLYDGPMEKIALTQEVEYINKYIELQKIRTSNVNYVTFEVAGDTDHTLIAPMLFIPFIENAFKHSVNKKIDNAIEVKLSADKNHIGFYCSNAYDASVLQTQPKSGLGLELIKNRLKLLYGDNYNLAIDKADNRFTVNLTISINGDQLHHN